MSEINMTFEQGPIRPPNEARSFLLRVTRNCPWNRCLFCPVYKRRKFSLRTVEEIKQDILTARHMADEVKSVSVKMGYNGQVTEPVLSSILSSSDYNDWFGSIASWLYFGTGACFLQDADNFVMPPDSFIEILTFLREKFPEIKRVTTYSRSRTIVRRSADTIRKIRKAGLDRVHIGLESGSYKVLKLVDKGVTPQQQIEAGQKCIEAGLELSEYVMPGLGGRDLWKEHAIETAGVLNEINPHFIRLRSLRVPKRVPLYQKIEDGTFSMQTDDMAAQEIKVFIKNLDRAKSTVTSDHIMNLLEDVSGKLPEDMDKMISAIERYQNLPEQSRLIYRIGRRGGVFRSVDDLKYSLDTVSKIENLIQETEKEAGKDGVEKMISDMVDQYI